jgi:hypothetical protein
MIIILIPVKFSQKPTTDSMEKIPFSDADNHSAGKEIMNLLCSNVVHSIFDVQR